MRVRLTRYARTGTVIVPMGDKTGPVSIVGDLMVFDRAREIRRREAELRGKAPPPDVLARDITQALRRRGRLVFVNDLGDRLISSSINDIDWSTPITVQTMNSRYTIEPL